MEIQGKVIAVLPIKDGVGKTSGNEWKSREFVLATEESRPQSLCLQLMNANIDRYAVEAGQQWQQKESACHWHIPSAPSF